MNRERILLLVAAIGIIALSSFLLSSTPPSPAFADLSVGNSTTTALDDTEIFTGTWQLTRHPDLLVVASTDQNGLLYADFSHDGVTTHSTLTYNVAASTYEIHKLIKSDRYFRLRFINNSSSDQTTLSLQAYLGDFDTLTAPLNLPISSDSDATIVRSVSSDLDLAFGRFNGMTEDSKFGSVKNIDAADLAVDVWGLADDGLSGGVDTKTFPTTAQPLYLSSTSGSDTDVDIRVTYVDSIGELQTITATLAGTSVVTVGVSALDSNRLQVINENLNVGGVYLTTDNAHTTGVPDDLTTVLAYIRATEGQSQQAIDYVPTGCSYRLKRLVGFISRSSGSGGSVDLAVQVKEPAGAWVTKRTYFSVTGQFDKPSAGLVLDEGTYIRVRLLDVSDTDTSVTFEWHFDALATTTGASC